MTKPSEYSVYQYGTSSDDTIFGPEQESVIYGGKGRDKLFGGGFRDFLYGEEGADELYGRGGNDYLDGGGDGDVLDGGRGIDSVNYHSSSEAVTVNLATGEASGGEAEGDTLISIESVRGSHFDDVLIGDDGDNFMCDLGGDDAMFGGEGDDILRGAEEADWLDGGSGFDTATYWSSNAGVTVDLGAGTGSGGHAEGDVLVGFEAVIGSADFDDKLTAGNDAVVFYGHGGDDILTGGAGNDSLFGGTGADVLSGGGGADMLFGEDGADAINGGAGNDLITAGEGDDTILGGSGADQFKFRRGDGHDLIADFEAGLDSIVFSDRKTSWRDITTTEIGEDVLIEYGTDSIYVHDATAGEVWDMFQFY